MTPRVTMLQIARRAGVSLGTVSHVVNGKVPVRDPLRSRVEEAIRELGYQPSPLARGLRTNSTNIIGMIVPDITNPFFPAVVRGAEDVTYRHQYHLVLCNTDNEANKERSYFQGLDRFLPAGLIVIPSENVDLARLTSRPVVCVDRKISANWAGDTITVDNERGGLMATRHLLELGHRRIGIITGPLLFGSSNERLAGYQRAMRKAGIDARSEWIQQCQFTREAGRAATLRLLGMLPRPTAIFAASDQIALGVLSALKERGLRCPENLSLVGFDGLEITEFTLPALTTVYQPGYQLGAMAATVLIDRIHNPKRKAQQVTLEVELRIRDSSARISPEIETPAPRRRKARRPL